MIEGVACIRAFQDAYVYITTGWIAEINRVFDPFSTASPLYGYDMPILMEAQKKKSADLKVFKNPVGWTLATMLYVGREP